MSPRKFLMIYVRSYLKDNQLPSKLIEEVPQKWEKYGDFVLFDARSFSSEEWFRLGAEFWEKICDILKCRRIALKSKIRNDGFRSPNVRIIVGDDPWIMCVDNSIKYSWNVEKTMFCAGNASERQRIAKLDCRNQTVVDMFAGIGYFVLPFLIHAKADMVFACEWNPDAITALKRNLVLNKVADKCVVYEGDNRVTCPKGIADRVNLGLIPSSQGSWTVACKALRPTGGILHVHENVETMKTDSNCGKCSELMVGVADDAKISVRSDDELLLCGKWNSTWKRRQWMQRGVHVLHVLSSILRDEIDREKKWLCSIENVHCVKSYAPHVEHLVLDVSLKPV